MRRPSRSGALGRGSNTLRGAALQNDIVDPTANELVSANGNSIVFVKDGNRYTATTIILGPNITLVTKGPGVIQLDATVPTPPPAGSTNAYNHVSFIAQSGGADDRTRLSVEFAVMDVYTEARLLIMQSNSNGGTYTAQYHDGVSWVNLGPSVVTGGEPAVGPYLSTWTAIDPGALGGGGFPLRINQTGTSGDTDVTTATLIFKGVV